MSGAHQKPLNELGAGEIVRGTRSGAFTCEAVARACLDRIAARDSVVHAWVNLDPDLVLKNARALDAAKTRGPLHGVPIGVKDVLDTFDFPTEMGSPIYRKHKPDADAAVVERQLGYDLGAISWQEIEACPDAALVLESATALLVAANAMPPSPAG